jgi:outer membrane lipoprotein LolB
MQNKTTMICAALLLSGCATQMKTQEITTSTSTGKAVTTTQQVETNKTVTTTNASTAANTTEATTPNKQSSKIASASSAIHAWNIQGMLGVRSAKKAWSAQLAWQQNGPSNYHIRLYGPMGGGTTLIDKSNGIVTYQSEHKKAQSKHAGTLMKQQTGMAFPVESLYYWVRGIPAPGAVGSSHYGSQKELELLQQGGYTINYTEYRPVKGYLLPTKMKLEGQGIVMKFVVKSWNVS